MKSKTEMSKQTKFDVAKEVLSRFMALACKDEFDPEDPATQVFLEDERRLNEFDETVIDKILNEYAPYIKVGDDNE